jgi:ADP-heptose:LPS heptosyltransferase
VITNALRDFKLSGVHLKNQDKTRFAEIAQRLSELSTLFENNIQDATDNFSLELSDSPEDLKKLVGIPEINLQAAREKAKEYIRNKMDIFPSSRHPGEGRGPEVTLDTGLRRYDDRLSHVMPGRGQKTILFLHGTTWATKHWPDKYWIKLGQDLNQADFKILLPWGSTQEKIRADYFAQNFKAEVLPKLSIGELAELMTHQITGIVALDSGLTHLAAFLNIPTVSLYGPTDPLKTGARGENQKILQANFSCAPCLSKTCSYQGINPDPEIFPACFSSISPGLVYDVLLNLLAETPGEFLR